MLEFFSLFFSLFLAHSQKKNMLDSKNIRFNPTVEKCIRPENDDILDLFGGIISLIKENYCYYKVQSYIAYAAKTTGRRGMTLYRRPPT